MKENRSSGSTQKTYLSLKQSKNQTKQTTIPTAAVTNETIFTNATGFLQVINWRN